jgi:methionine sulfoxide reductase heme-binding subunit
VSDADAPTTAPVRARPFRYLGAASVLWLLAVGLAAAREAWPVARELMLSRGTGWLALTLLLASLCITPLARLWARCFPKSGSWWRASNAWRRALGMLAAWLALLHAGLAFAGLPAGSAGMLITWPHLRAGLCALVLLLLLLATSFGAVIQRLRLSLWRELHRLVYVAALLVLQHVLLSPFAPRALTLGLFGAALLLGLLRLLRVP